MSIGKSFRKACKVLIVADCDYQDKPLGGVVSLLRNMLMVGCGDRVEFSLAGISFDPQEIAGVWQEKNIGNNIYHWMPVYVCRKAKEDTKFPIRFRLVGGVKRYLQSSVLNDFDAIYIHSVEVALALPRMDIPIICHVHSDPLLTIIRSRFPLLQSHFFVRQYDKIIQKVFDRSIGIIWAADACRREYYRRLGVDRVSRWDNKSTVIHSSVDPVMLDELEKVQPSSRDKLKRIVTVSRLSEVKHIDFLIKVFSELKRKNPDIEFNIAGEGECEAALRRQVEELNCIDCVHFLGNLNKRQLANLLSRMDVFVFASESEAMSLVILESMAAGVPVVSTNVGDISQVVNSSTGAILESRNIDSFIEAVEGCLAVEKTQYERACKSVAQAFTAERMRRSIEEFIVRGVSG